MPRARSQHPTRLELSILKILWEKGELAVRDVRTALAQAEGRDLAHTTVVTTLNTMVEKGQAKRRVEGNAYFFAARRREEDVSRGMLGDLVRRLFGGSARALMLNLVQCDEVPESERRELRQLIKQSRRKNPS